MASSPLKNPGRPDVEEVQEEVYEYKEVKYIDFVKKPKYIPYWILAIVIVALVALITIYHDPIVEFLRPTSEKIRDVPAGWLIPIVILVIISFPPLFGHEIVGLLCGVVYGLWIGFAILAAGTFIGEIGTWYAFKYAFRRKAEKLERTNLNYGALARFTREGGFWVVLIIRFSVIPSHFSTAVLSTCNVKFWHFAIATFLTLPKQIVLVYLGVLLVQQSTDNKINLIVLGITGLITVVAGVYVYQKMRVTKKILLEEQAARLSAKQNMASEYNPVMREDENFWQPDRYDRDNIPMRPAAAGHYHQEAYEMDETRRPSARTQEFI